MAKNRTIKGTSTTVAKVPLIDAEKNRTGLKIPRNEKPRVRVNVTDGFQNLATGYGVGGIDNQKSFTYRQQLRAFDYLTLDSMYTTNGFARQVIDLLPKEMVREWINIKNDPDGNLLRYMEKLDTKPLFMQALQWARLYGGSLIFLVIEDGREMWEPVDETNIRDIKMMKVFDRFQTTILNYYTQLKEIDKYGHPEIYDIIDPVRGTLYSIHESRTIRFNGINSTMRFKLANQGWSQSLLTLCWDQLIHLTTAYESASRSMQTNNETVVQIKNLMDYLTDAKQTAALQERIYTFNTTRNTMNALLADDEEKIERLNNTFTDVPAMIKEFGYELCAVTGYPFNKFFGDSTGGLSGAGDYDTGSFYDDVKSEQEYSLLPAINRLLYLIKLAKNSPVKPETTEKPYTPEFNPLWQEKKKTKADTELVEAQRDKTYYDMNVLSAQEIRTLRGFDNTDAATPEEQAERNRYKDKVRAQLANYKNLPPELKQLLGLQEVVQPGSNPATTTTETERVT